MYIFNFNLSYPIIKINSFKNNWLKLINKIMFIKFLYLSEKWINYYIIFIFFEII
jgi:hypothetical protein